MTDGLIDDPIDLEILKMTDGLEPIPNLRLGPLDSHAGQAKTSACAGRWGRNASRTYNNRLIAAFAVARPQDFGQPLVALSDLGLESGQEAGPFFKSSFSESWIDKLKIWGNTRRYGLRQL